MEKDIKGLAEKKLAEKLTKIYKWGAGSERAGYYDPEEAQEAILSDAQEIITTLEKEFGYIISTSKMKLIGDEENIWHNFPIAEIEAWQDGRNKQLSADRLTRDKKREELEARNKKLVDALKSIREWLMFPKEIKEDGVWNEQFVKANNLVNQALAQEKG